MDPPRKRESVAGRRSFVPKVDNSTGRLGRSAFNYFSEASRIDLFFQLDMAAKKARQTVKQLATKGDVKSARILAKEVVRSDKQKDRLSVSKARLGSIGTQLSQQIG